MICVHFSILVNLRFRHTFPPTTARSLLVYFPTTDSPSHPPCYQDKVSFPWWFWSEVVGRYKAQHHKRRRKHYWCWMCWLKRTKTHQGISVERHNLLSLFFLIFYSYPIYCDSFLSQSYTVTVSLQRYRCKRSNQDSFFIILFSFFRA